MTSIVCIDTVIQAPVQSQTGYIWSDVRFGHRFVEIYTDHPDGQLVVDYGRLHETEPVPAHRPSTQANASSIDILAASLSSSPIP